MAPTIQSRYQLVRENIARIASSCGRDESEIQLVVVTKTFPVSSVREVVTAGAKVLGENYVEESIPKIIALQDESNLQWHMIGHIQSRKTKDVAEYFDVVETIDRVKVARRLNDTGQELNKKIPALLEINISGEQSKYGIPSWDETNWPNLLNVIQPFLEFPHLQICGLMTLAPYFDVDEAARPYFRKLRKLREFLVKNIPTVDWHHLSMGMSGDYRVAIEEGATIVRIGTAVMGVRT
jgi:PLP dependent protein